MQTESDWNIGRSPCFRQSEMSNASTKTIIRTLVAACFSFIFLFLLVSEIPWVLSSLFAAGMGGLTWQMHLKVTWFRVWIELSLSECNMPDVPLFVCPNKYERVEKKRFSSGVFCFAKWCLSTTANTLDPKNTLTIEGRFVWVLDFLISALVAPLLV